MLIPSGSTDNNNPSRIYSATHDNPSDSPTDAQRQVLGFPMGAMFGGLGGGIPAFAEDEDEDGDESGNDENENADGNENAGQEERREEDVEDDDAWKSDASATESDGDTESRRSSKAAAATSPEWPKGGTAPPARKASTTDAVVAVDQVRQNPCISASHMFSFGIKLTLPPHPLLTPAVHH